MAMSTSVFMSHVPTGIPEEELRNFLWKGFNIVNGVNNLNVKVFRPQGRKQKAIAFGFFAKFEDLCNSIEGTEIRKTKIRMFNDDGDERDQYGNFVNPAAPEQKRMHQKMKGETSKKLIGVFSMEFWTKVNLMVYNGVTSESVSFNKGDLDLSKLEKVSTVKMLKAINSNFSIIKFGSVVDTLNAIRYFNLNPNFWPDGKFCDKKGQETSTVAEAKGILLMEQQGLVTIKDAAANNLIRFKWIDPDILSNALFDFKATCLRCQKLYEIFGVEINLNYLSATCACDYDSNLDVLDKTRGFFWKGENFTRLSLLSAYSNELDVLHYPLKYSGAYSSAEEYRSIVLPLLYSEWKAVSRPFKSENSCTGELKEYFYVETLKTDGRMTDFFGLKIQVPVSSFWKIDNRLVISMLTLQLSVRHKKYPKCILQCKRKAKVLHVKNQQAQSSLMIQVQVELEYDNEPVVNATVEITPKMDKLQYDSSKQMINRWSKEKCETLPAQKVILDPRMPIDWKASIQDIHPKRIKAIVKYLLFKFHDPYNAEQKQAMKNAFQNCLSFIHGPPGTGKTFTAAVIIVTLSILEKGTIVATAPSNVACDGLCLAIAKADIHKSCKPKVLRIYAKRRENALMDGGEGLDELDTTIHKLHEVVRSSPNWLNSSELKDIHDKIQSRQRFKLTKDEHLMYKAHVSKIELEVISQYDVIVSTFSALSDRRVSSWNHDAKITTVVADEIGQASQPDTLPLFLLHAKRYCFIGDHLQLTSGISSHSVKSSGLAISLMEWIAKAMQTGDCDIPWTTLYEQRRMKEEIRELVSNLTYGGKLRDAPEISSRIYDYSKIYAAMGLKVGEKMSSVVVFDHNDPEEPIGKSFRNVNQAGYIVDLVGELLRHGVPPEEIVILTLYEGQRREIKFQLSEENITSAVKLKNVDAFQGREGEIVIVSMTRCNKDGSLGFTSNQNRINVAFSRAKYQLFVFLSLRTMQKSKKKALKDLQQILPNVALIKCLK